MLSGLREASHALRLLRGGDVEGWESEGAKSKARRRRGEEDGAHRARVAVVLCLAGLRGLHASSRSPPATPNTLHAPIDTRVGLSKEERRAAKRAKKEKKQRDGGDGSGGSGEEEGGDEEERAGRGARGELARLAPCITPCESHTASADAATQRAMLAHSALLSPPAQAARSAHPSSASASSMTSTQTWRWRAAAREPWRCARGGSYYAVRRLAPSF